MKSTIKEIELVTEFPCLMEYKIYGEDSVGIYLVNRYESKKDTSNEFSVCLVLTRASDVNIFGVMYFKEKLDPLEWFPLPKGTQITLTN